MGETSQSEANVHATDQESLEQLNTVQHSGYEMNHSPTIPFESILTCM